MDSRTLQNISRMFNRYRVPECRVRARLSNNTVVAEFTGTAASFSCCFDEHFEDYRQMLGESATLVRMERKGKERFLLIYRLDD